MKTNSHQRHRALVLAALISLALPAMLEAQFTFTTNVDNTITITGYSGLGRMVIIPDTTNGLQVTGIGVNAFYGNSVITNITLGANVTKIRAYAFQYCNNLTAIIADTNNRAYSSVAGVLFSNSQTVLVQYPPGKTGSYTIPDSVTDIGDGAFATCYGLTNVAIGNNVVNIGTEAFFTSGLTSVVIPDSVHCMNWGPFFGCTSLTNVKIGNGISSIPNYAFAYCSHISDATIGKHVTLIASEAFYCCSSLTAVRFQGNAPSLGEYVFQGDYFMTVYYLPGTTGWSDFSADTGIATAAKAPWFVPNPIILDFEPEFGVQTNYFGFTVSWSTNAAIVVEARTDLANFVWSPITTNTLLDGSFYFSDLQWTNYPGRFYQLRTP